MNFYVNAENYMRVGKHDPKGCIGCQFLRDNWCGYADITGRTKLSQGVHLNEKGGCDLKTVPLKQCTKEMPFEERVQVLRSAYFSGMTDKEIAELACVGRDTVRRWREASNLSANRKG